MSTNKMKRPFKKESPINKNHFWCTLKEYISLDFAYSYFAVVQVFKNKNAEKRLKSDLNKNNVKKLLRHHGIQYRPIGYACVVC